MKLPTYNEITPYVEGGYVTERKHPYNEDLRIFNYTMECQFDKKWDNVTMNCRGLIMNIKTGEHLSRPFPKFFNLDEHFHLGYQLPDDETPEVLEKMDGSLGILYFVDDCPMIATRGSFESEQAKWATAYFSKHIMSDPHYATFVKTARTSTFLFEIIYPENRIVVNYDYSGLVLLAVHDIETGVGTAPQYHPLFPVAKKFKYEPLSHLKKHDRANEEGYVLYYPKANVRVKIKFDDYVRLHNVVTGLSERGIWEMMVQHGPATSARDMLQDVPDEFHNWMDGVVKRLQSEYDAIFIEASAAVRELAVLGLTSRKDQAIHITSNSKYPSVAFAMLDESDYQSIIFKQIKPSGSKVFTDEV
jgi:RNA ligase